MNPNRSGENGKIPQRHERFFQADEYWYYTTREGVDIGPFDSLEDASSGANEFVDFISTVQPAFGNTLEKYRAGATA